MPTLEDAIALAVEAHRGQQEKTGQPYILHALRVMLRLETEFERMAGVLHDVVEDTRYTLDEVRHLSWRRLIVSRGSTTKRTSTSSSGRLPTHSRGG